MKTIEFICGTDIFVACCEAVKKAIKEDCDVQFDFNGISLIASPETNPEQLKQDYHDQLSRETEELLASPEYQAKQKKLQEEAARREKERKEKVDSIMVGAPDEMTLADVEGWAKAKAANTDGYGGAVMAYAERWARMMEARMAKGEKLEDIADECSHLADEEGITGFMYGGAVSTLIHVWKYGEELKR